jgi:hypothetical protein
MQWWALILALPTANATARTRIWRALKALGAGTLRDGVYLLPARPELRAALEAIEADAAASDGSAQIVRMVSEGEAQQRSHVALFDRREAYAELLGRIEEARRALKVDSEGAATRTLRRLQRTFDELRSVDFFPGQPQERARNALEHLTRLTAEKFSPGEPTMSAGEIERLDVSRFQRRTWATRRRPGIDRLASAWLIRRFIDASAKFAWLAKPTDIAPRAVGFDFDGAQFTHRGERVTYEVLMASFGLDEDKSLVYLAGVVHHLDVGGDEPPEAAGVSALIEGLRVLHEDDDQLCAAALATFDGLYRAFKNGGKRHG